MPFKLPLSKANIIGPTRMSKLWMLFRIILVTYSALINSLKGIMNSASKESKDVIYCLTFALSMENGLFWDDAYASDALDDMASSEIFKSVLTKLHGVVACHPEEVEPKTKKARHC